MTYTSSDQVVLFSTDITAFSGPASPGFSCSNGFSVELITWETNGSIGLCMDFDPDSPCTGRVYVRQPGN